MLKWKDYVAQAGQKLVNAKQLALRPARRVRSALGNLVQRVPRRGLAIGIYLILILCMFGIMAWRAQQPELGVTPTPAEEREMLREELALYEPEDKEDTEQAVKEEEVTESTAQPSTSLNWPVEGEILVEHGAYLTEGLNGRTQHRYHVGIDIAAAEGTTVRSITDGRVIRVKEEDLFYRRSVLVEHGNITALYGNLGEIFVREGDEINQGYKIGTVGRGALVDSGKDEPYLHFELKSNGKVVDPLALLPN